MNYLRAGLLALSIALFVPCLLAACSGGGNAPAEQTRQDAVGDNIAAVEEIREFTLPSAQQQTSQEGAEGISLLLRAEDYDEAIDKARSALEASPHDPSIRQKLADAYIARAWFYKLKRLTTYTLADLSRAVQAAPDYYRSHYEIGLFHNNQWQFSLGQLDFDRCIELNPDYAPAYAERAYSHYKNLKYDLALSDVNESIKMDPAPPRPYCVRSLVYAAMGKMDLALKDAEKAVLIAPQDAFSYYNRGLIYAAAGKPDLAMADFETTLGLSQDDLLSERARLAILDLQK
ncbi:MAG: tetratricopeptide repeat protein [Dehalococcoidia bacterium]|nr:tetratricopeptide repeat protein [Dehalococcoidia bacterium]